MSFAVNQFFSTKYGIDDLNITSIPLEGEGKVLDRVQILYNQLVKGPPLKTDQSNSNSNINNSFDKKIVNTNSNTKNANNSKIDSKIDFDDQTDNSNIDKSPTWLQSLISADMIMGTPVSIILLARLIEEGLIDPYRTRICILGMAGVTHGPFPSLKTVVRYFEAEPAKELFTFCDGDSMINQRYQAAMTKVLNSNVKVICVASWYDQVVPMYSAVMHGFIHPNIYRAVHIEGSDFKPDFLSHLIVFTLKLRNFGYDDRGLVVHLSDMIAGNVYGFGTQGHSTIYEETNTYTLAVAWALGKPQWEQHQPINSILNQGLFGPRSTDSTTTQENGSKRVSFENSDNVQINSLASSAAKNSANSNTMQQRSATTSSMFSTGSWFTSSTDKNVKEPPLGAKDEVVIIEQSLTKKNATNDDIDNNVIVDPKVVISNVNLPTPPVSSSSINGETQQTVNKKVQIDSTKMDVAINENISCLKLGAEPLPVGARSWFGAYITPLPSSSNQSLVEKETAPATPPFSSLPLNNEEKTPIIDNNPQIDSTKMDLSEKEDKILKRKAESSSPAGRGSWFGSYGTSSSPPKQTAVENEFEISSIPPPQKETTPSSNSTKEVNIGQNSWFGTYNPPVVKIIESEDVEIKEEKKQPPIAPVPKATQQSSWFGSFNAPVKPMGEPKPDTLQGEFPPTRGSLAFHAPRQQLNPYWIPFIMAELFNDPKILENEELGRDLRELLVLFRSWNPETKPFRDLKYMLEPLKSRL